MLGLFVWSQFIFVVVWFDDLTRKGLVAAVWYIYKEAWANLTPN